MLSRREGDKTDCARAVTWAVRKQLREGSPGHPRSTSLGMRTAGRKRTTGSVEGGGNKPRTLGMATPDHKIYTFVSRKRK